MQQYEYKILSYKNKFYSDSMLDGLERLMNKHAKEGWRTIKILEETEVLIFEKLNGEYDSYNKQVKEFIKE